jgi:uncharacterized protein YbjT (DUF2867 family)
MTAAAVAETKSRSVLVIGSTGLVGSECIRLLSADPTCTRVVALTRNPATIFPASTKLEIKVVDFDNLEKHKDLFAVDQIICALGTTMRKTPSQDVYRKIDYGYPLEAAKHGLAHGATHYLVVTAVGANAKSSIFYNRLKGELEDALALLDYRSLTIARPSVLIGERLEPRRSEKIAWKLGFLTPKKYKPVTAVNVAKALVKSAREDLPGMRIVQNPEMLQA